MDANRNQPGSSLPDRFEFLFYLKFPFQQPEALRHSNFCWRGGGIHKQISLSYVGSALTAVPITPPPHRPPNTIVCWSGRQATSHTNRIKIVKRTSRRE